MKRVLVLICAVLMVGVINAQKSAAINEASIHTSAVCDMCKKTIEDGLYMHKGIVNAVVNVETKVVTVKYKSAKVTLDDIRKYISLLGYDADDVLADKQAHDHLPACCQGGNGEHH